MTDLCIIGFLLVFSNFVTNIISNSLFNIVTGIRRFFLRRERDYCVEFSEVVIVLFVAQTPQSIRFVK